MRSHLLRASIVWGAFFGLACAWAAERSASACHESPSYRLFGKIRSQIEPWNRFLAGLERGSPVAPQVDRYRAMNGYPLELIASGNAPLAADLARLEIEEDEIMSGTTIVAFLKKLPPAWGQGGAHPLAGELVIELDGAGKPKQRWTNLFNHGVAGLRGNEILVDDSAGPLCQERYDETRHHHVWLAIRPDGSFRVVSPDPDPPQVECEPCSSPDYFKNSAYVGCCRFKDLETGKIRTLMYQHPTT